MSDELVRTAAKNIMEFIGADPKYAKYAQVLTYIEWACPDHTCIANLEAERDDVIRQLSDVKYRFDLQTLEHMKLSEILASRPTVPKVVMEECVECRGRKLNPKFHLSLPQKCTTCNGWGKVHVKCEECGGECKVSDSPGFSTGNISKCLKCHSHGYQIERVAYSLNSTVWIEITEYRDGGTFHVGFAPIIIVGMQNYSDDILISYYDHDNHPREIEGRYCYADKATALLIGGQG